MFLCNDLIYKALLGGVRALNSAISEKNADKKPLFREKCLPLGCHDENR